MKIGIADIVTAFQAYYTVGSKVTSNERFLADLAPILRDFNFASCRVPGQGYIVLPDKFRDYVTSGVGEKTQDVNDYVIRFYRGAPHMFLRRKEFVRPDQVAVVVYELGAYKADPDITPKEKARVESEGLTHILVAILASCGPRSTLSPGRFVANLAGGNNEALLWTADEIREKAKEIQDYNNSWGVVAD